MQKRRGQWWQQPELHTESESEHERKVSWLELFYDLVFVVVIAQLSHHLAAHMDVKGVLGFILLFLPVWWMWIGATFYNDRFETHDVSYRLFVFVQMACVAALAIFSGHALDSTSIPFALTYIVARTVLVGMWIRAGYHTPQFRPVSTRYAIGFSISILIFFISVLVPPPWRFLCWGLGLALDFFTPIFTIKQQRRLPRLDSAKLVERMGLFTLIVLGESVVATISGVAEVLDFSFIAGIRGILGLGIAFALWWIYFDFIARRRPRPGPWWLLSWCYLHLPMVIALAATGAGVLNTLSFEGEVLPLNIRLTLSGAIAAALVASALIEITLSREPDEPTNLHVSAGIKLATGLVALLLGLGWSSVGPTSFLAVLLVLLAIQMFYGAYVWFNQPHPAEQVPEFG